MDYRAAGVDREAADTFIENLKSEIEKTSRPEVLSSIGDFGGFFEAPKNLKDPIWVATTDGVGTKLVLAEEVGGVANEAVGQDVVAMCVNDLIACRAEPIVFLDYLATGKLDSKSLGSLMKGIVSGCRESGCALIGGETAEMPGYYPAQRYDVAGFSIGALERSHRLNRESSKPGDLIFAFPSSGFHSNGYSLVRKVLKDQNWKLSDSLEGVALSKALLEPTKLYVRPMLEVFRRVNVKAAAHITGGGLIENLPRGVNEAKVQMFIRKDKIPTSSLMKRFVEAARLDEREAFSTWNMGVGFCFIISPEEKNQIADLPVIEIGHLEVRPPQSESVVLI
jgi:phosphoribosylformylglycinamidine cyclo-ligase